VRPPTAPLKLAMLATVQRLVDVRADLLHQVGALQHPDAPSLTVNIHSPSSTLRHTWPQDDAILALVRPAIVRELLARVASIETDLRTMGVEVD